MRSRNVTIVAVGFVVVLAALSTVVIGGFASGFARSDCAPRRVSGTGVRVALMDAGGSMMGRVQGGTMRLAADRSRVEQGLVTFVAANVGSIGHELLVLRLPRRQIVGTRPIGADGAVDERGDVGEASNDCARGTGDGIPPGRASWTSLQLRRGSYELLCNLPGHYAAGMYTRLTVT